VGLLFSQYLCSYQSQECEDGITYFGIYGSEDGIIFSAFLRDSVPSPKTMDFNELGTLISMPDHNTVNNLPILLLTLGEFEHSFM
jgi:hypothetical protein